MSRYLVAPKTIAAIAVACCCASSVSFAQTDWNGSVDSDWQVAGNWSAGLPNSSANARIYADGPVSLAGGNASVNQLSIGFLQNLTVSGGAQLDGQRLDVGFASDGQMLVTGNGTSARFSSASLADVVIGTVGNGVLTISDGALFQTGTSNSYEIGLGNQGGNGTLNITSGGTLATTSVRKEDGGQVNFDGGIFRSLLNSNNVFIGFSAGEINLLAGGGTFDTDLFSVTITTPLSGVGGLTKTGTGMLTLTGNNTYAGGTSVGNGTLAVNSGGQINHGSAGMDVGTVAGQTGTLSIGANSSVTSHRSNVGYGGKGVAVVSGSGAQWTINEHLYVGASSNGSLTVASGGQVDVASVLFVGNNAGVSGAITINGTGSEVTAGQVVAGRSGQGTINLVSGGTLTIDGGTGELHLGQQSSGDGTLNIGTGGVAGILNAGNIYGGIPSGGNGTVNFNHTGTVDFSPNILGNVAVNKLASGTTILTGTNNYTRGTTISGGTLQIGNGGTAGSITGDVTNNATLAFNRSDDITFAGMISGTGQVQQIGGGALTLSGANTYSGGTLLANGTLLVGDNDALGTGTLTILEGTTIGNVAGSSFSLSNNLTISGNFSANIGVSDLLEFGGTTDLGSGMRTITMLDDGLLCFAGPVTGSGGLTILAAGNATGSFSLCGPDDNTFAGPLVVGNNVLVSLEKDPGAIALAGNLTVMDGGYVSVMGGMDQIAPTSTVSVNGTLELMNFVGNSTARWAALNGSSSGAITNSLSPVSLEIGSGNFAGAISDAGAGSELELVKYGPGTLTLTGNNTYLGGTVVRGGTLAVGGGGSITHSGGNLTVGESAGDSGVFAIGANGTLSAFRGFVGYDGGAVGALEIAGGNATFADELYIGYTGNGTLELSGNGTLSNTKAFIGVNSPSVSSANITGGQWINSGELTVGYGGQGSLAISGNGAVTSAGAFLGFLSTSNANTATISGPGASWTSTGTFYLGNDGSDNSIRVSGGGSLLTENADFLIGSNAGSGNNSLAISGNGSNFTNNATLYVGRSGTGNSLSIEDGATVASRNVRIGGGTGSSGTTSDNFVNVAGAGSSWTINGTLRVGSSGDNSSLTISDGASVSVAGNTFLGYDAVSDGNSVLLSGNGSKWTVGALTVGRFGTNNTVTVADGGNLTASSLLLAEQAGSSGTLRIGNGTAAGIVSAPLITGGNGTALVEFNHSDTDLDFAPALAGSLSVRHSGTGTTTVNSSNTYTGGTQIDGGTLRTQSASALGTGGVTLNAGALDPVGQLDISTLAWNGGTVASGLGTLTDLVNISGNLTLGGGGGVFAFTGESGFAPNTAYTILGALNLDDSLLALFSGNQLLGLDPVFSRTGTSLLVNFAGSSTGPLLQNVGGPWTPTNANFVVSGPVQTGNATASNTVNSLLFRGGSSLRVLNTLTVGSGQFDVPTGSASISGGTVAVPGDFSKIGAGTLVANSNFNIRGAGAVNAGALYVNGRFAVPGGLTVFQNALLGGCGTIAGNLFNNGTVAPGNSPGTLAVTGDFTQSSGGTLQIEIASLSVFDRLVVGGAANLDGTLQVLNAGNKLKYGQRYAFLQAGRISGEFDRILLPQPSKFRGRFLAEGGTGSLIVAPTSYTLVAQTDNQRRVARALDSYIPARSGDRQAVSIALDVQTEEQYPAAFDQISPGFYESLTEITVGQAFAQTQMLNQRMSSVRLGARGFQAIGLDEQPLKNDKGGSATADPKDGKALIEIPDSPNWSAWAMGTGTFSKSANIGNVPNYRSEAGGFLAGADYTFGGGEGAADGRPSLTAGVYGGYNYTYAKYANGSNTQINTALFGLYGTYSQGGYYADAVIGGGYNGYRARRSIEFSTVDRTARSTPDGGQFSAAINLGRDWKAKGFTFGPIAGLQYTYAGVAPFTEEGAESLDLRLSQQNDNSLIMTLGGRVAYTWNVARSVTLIPEVRVFWQHEFLDNPALIGAALDGGAGPGFNYETGVPDRDSVFAGAGLTAQVGERWNAFFYYNADFARQDYLSHAISAGLGFKF